MGLHYLIDEIGSEFDWGSNLDFFLRNSSVFESLFMDGKFFRSGRDALFSIGEIMAEQGRTVFLPALCCESMVDPFKRAGCCVEFYSLNSDFSVKYKYLDEVCDSKSAVVFMEYFGNTMLSDEQQHTLSTRGVTLIQDITHNALSFSHSAHIDYSVGSLRKWFALPDGGIVLGDQEHLRISECSKNETYFSDKRTKGLVQKSSYLLTGKSVLKDSYRELLVEAENYISSNALGKAITVESMSVLEFINFQKIGEKRRENVLMLKDLLGENAKVHQIAGVNNEVLLYFPIWVANQKKVQTELSKRDIFCPVIWPIPAVASSRCSFSSSVSEHMLALPCDQRYDCESMHRIARNLLEVCAAL